MRNGDRGQGFLVLIAAVMVASFSAAGAVSWPQFRGKNCSGIAESDKPPTEFGPETNLLWKTELSAGLSSPCIWENQIFLTTVSAGKLETVCVDRREGKVVWRKSAPAEKLEEVNPGSSPATATPATDGNSVFVYFGSYGLIAYGLDGTERWRKPLPLVNSLNGSGASPALIDGLVIVNRDQEEGKSSLLAVDGKTGKTVWETPRPKSPSSYSTPIVWERGQEKDVVLAGSLQVVGYDLKTGKARWSADGLEAISVCPTPVIGEGQLYTASRSMGGMSLPSFATMARDMDKNEDQKIARAEAKGMLGSKQVFNVIDENKDGVVTAPEWDASVAMMSKGDYGIFALRGPGSGDVTATHVAWKNKKGVATVPSPLFYRGRVHLIQDGGRATCYRAKTGETLYEQERIDADGEYWASPIAANGKIYLASTRGTVSVIEAADEMKVLARNKVGEKITATPAIADDKLYVRTAKHLWAFGGK